MKKHEKGMAIAIIAILTVGLLTVMVLLMSIVAKAEYVTAESGLRVRSKPNLEAEVIMVVPFGEQVEGPIINGWMKTEDGYMKAEFLSEDDPLGGFAYLGNWRLTAYYETGCATASGAYPEVNVTAAHNTLPFGSRLYVKGFGIWTVQDRGPASMGTEWADLYLGDYGTCIQFGEKTAEVYLIPEKEMP